jgi:hypothetical protein
MSHPADRWHDEVARDLLVRDVWAAWNTLDDDEPTPVQVIAERLGLPRPVVAAIVYPPDTFGQWKDDQE